jgi:ATPase complex subunit ATP10
LINHPLGIENKILGYVYLVDPNLKIRWAGNAMATELESENLRRATAVLMKRTQGTQTDAAT